MLIQYFLIGDFNGSVSTLITHLEVGIHERVLKNITKQGQIKGAVLGLGRFVPNYQNEILLQIKFTS